MKDHGYLALAEIAKVSARSYEWLFKKQAKVGLLSYSTLREC
jgi:phosphotransacetylase